MKKLFIAFLFVMSNIANGVDITVNKIYFNGLKRVSLDTALFSLPFKVGDVINENIIADSIKTLFSIEYFEEITITTKDAGTIVIQVKERPIISNISFHGNKTIQDNIIKQLLDSAKIQPGDPFIDSIVFTIEQELRNLCSNFGKFNATVKILVLSVPKNCVNLKIMFNEGKTAQVRKINITGNNTFHTTRLLKQFKLHDKTNKWRNILSNRQYQKQKLFHDLETLRNFYLNHGYAKFHIDNTWIELTPDKKNVYLYIQITEGMQYSFKSVMLYGNILDYFPKITKYININSGELYNNNKIQEIEYNIKYILSNHGYIQPTISIIPEINDSNKMVNLCVYVDVGNRFYVHEVSLEGNNITQDSVMRKMINQRERVQLNYNCIFKDQERLKRLGYFKTVNTRFEYIPNLPNQVNIIHTVEEHNTGNLNLSIGIGTESKVNAQCKISQENILGTGHSMSIVATKNYYQTYIEISALQVYCGVNKINIGSKIFYNDFNANNIDLSHYNLKNYGADINCSYSLTQYNTLDVGLNYISNYLSNMRPQVTIWRYLNSIGIFPQITTDHYLNNNINFKTNDFLLTLGWDINKLDNVSFPVSGSHVNILGKVTLPGSKNQYYKMIIDNKHYISINQNSNWTTMGAIYIGYAGSICKKESPFYDNFHAGGIDTIRGLRLNSIGPKAAYYYCNKFDKNYDTCLIKSSQDTIGGNAIVLFKAELIGPMLLFNKQYFFNTSRFSIFLDSGTVWDTFWKNTAATRSAGIIDYSIPNRIRVSGGVSLKWISPVGPVIFSYSKLLKKYLGDIEEPFQFSIGKPW